MKKKKSFTLVELLVVIAILALLSTVGTISYQSFKKKAEEKKDLFTASDINSVIKLYKVDNEIDCLSDLYHILNITDLLNQLKTSVEGRSYYYDPINQTVIYADEEYNIYNDVTDYSDYSNWIKLDYEFDSSVKPTEEASFIDLFK